MYEVKMEELKIEILENTNRDGELEQSVWICFCKFVGTWIMALGKLFFILFKGLWRFIQYAFYKFIAWVDKED